MSDEGQLASADKIKLAQDSAHQEREWTDIGTAKVTVDMFGRAKVQVIHQHSQVHRNVKIAIICALFIALALLVYTLSRDDGSAATEVVPALQEYAVPPIVNSPPASSIAPIAVVTPAQPVAKHPNKEQSRTDSAKQPATSAVAAAQPVKHKSKPRTVSVINQDAQAISPGLASPAQPSMTPAKAAGDITY